MPICTDGVSGRSRTALRSLIVYSPGVARMYWFVCLLMLVVSGAAGCARSNGRLGHDGHGPVRLVAGPARALYDTPVTFRVSGLSAGDMVLLRAETRDADGVDWSSSAQFAASSSGSVTDGQPSLGGSYTGVNPMGLFETLAPGGTPATQSAFVGPPNWTIALTASVGGRAVATTQLTRLRPSQLGVTEADERPAASGIYGDLFRPPHPVSSMPAVVVFGGSEGGLSGIASASLLAAHGYPALALAYFREPGLPQNLERIPLEYFATAVRLLAGQSGVDPHRVFVWGNSRGSEAALLLGAHFPHLVKGVIATVPSSVALPGLPDSAQPAWTLAGRPVPTAPATDFGNPTPSDAPAAVIPVEDIRGPVLLACAGDDQVWPSCPYADAITARLIAHHVAHPPNVLRYPHAGHLVGSLFPYVPYTRTSVTTASGDLVTGGGTPALDAAARADGWPRLLAFITGR